MPGPRACIEIAADIFYARGTAQPKTAVCLVGKPGTGKTQSGREIATLVSERLGEPVNFLCPPPAAAMDAVDNRGLPGVEVIEGHRRTTWAPPTFWPTDPDAVVLLFLDELGQGDPSVVNTYSMAIQSGHIGDDLKLPRRTLWLAATNRLEDKAGVKRFASHINDRFCFIDFEPSLDDFQWWAAQHGVLPDIRGYLNFKPDALCDFDPKRDERSQTSPRKWGEKVNDVVQSISSPKNLHAAVSGLVGEGRAAEYVAFRQIYLDLPDPKDCLKNPSKCTIPESKPDIMYALCMSLAEHSKTLDDFDALATLGMRFKPEFSAFCLRDVFAANAIRNAGGGVACPKKCYGGKMAGPKGWINQHRDVLLGVEAK